MLNRIITFIFIFFIFLLIATAIFFKFTKKPLSNMVPTEDVKGIQTVQGKVFNVSSTTSIITIIHENSEIALITTPETKIFDDTNILITAKDLRKGFKVTATGEQSSENTLTTEEIKIEKMPNIVVFSPTNLEDVGKSFLISGIARVFENKLSIMLTNSRTNTVLIKKTIDAKSPDTGKFVDFEYLTKIGNASLNDQDPLVLEVYSNSPKDGEKINYVSLNLIFRK